MVQMRLLELEDLKTIAKWPHFTEDSLLWANFNYRNEQEHKFWFRGNSTERNFWFSVFIHPSLATNRSISKGYLRELSRGSIPSSDFLTDSPRTGFFRKKSTDSILVGRISTLVPEASDELIFGIALHPDYLEFGIGTIATQMYLFAAFELTPISSVWLETQSINTRAQHVYEKIGFQRLGHHYKADPLGRQEKRYSYIFQREWKGSIPSIFEIS